MFDYKQHNLDIDTIIKRIKKEAKRRRAESADSFRVADLFQSGPCTELDNAEAGEPITDIFTRKIQAKLGTGRSLGGVFRASLAFGNAFSPYHDKVPLRELVLYHDAEFIENAYREILKRKPDPQGMDLYLTCLRSGRLGKVDILGKLRYSPEGRSRKVRINRLFFMYNLRRSYRLPVLGYLLSFITAVIMLPSIIKKTHENEAAIRAISASLRSVQKQLDQQHNVALQGQNIDGDSKT